MDFDKLAEDAPDVDATDPFELFQSLDKKQSHVDLRKVQVEVLTAWKPRRSERDIVLKLPTGAGKTTLGLLMVYSHMREAGKPGLFLCPTNQLIDQVLREGDLCGIPCVSFSGDGKNIPPSVISGDAVLVTSIQKLFNALTTAFKKINFIPGAMAMDDAHSAVEIIRKQFTIRAGMQDPLYAKLFGLFASVLREQGPGAFESIKANDPAAIVEVPYWAWLMHLQGASKILAEAAQEDRSPVALVWGLVSNCIQGVRCIFSGRGVELVPEVLPVNAVAAYAKAAHRFFMSATISDESQLVRELDCSPSAAEHPLAPVGAGGLGERMVIVPGLMHGNAGAMTWNGLVTLCKKLSAKYSVVVITPSNDAAKKWDGSGARIVTSDTDDVGEAVEALRNGKTQFAVFSNRYDGIDLPDDACRLLVLDGAPVSFSLKESIDGNLSDGVTGLQRVLVQRIEQGLGRAVRSPSDYAAVILWGDDLVNMVANKGLLQVMSEETRLQIGLGLTIAKQTKGTATTGSEIEDLVLKCLTRDAGWKKYYQQKAKPPAKADDSAERVRGIAFASLERETWQLYVSNRGNEAADRLQKYLNDNTVPDEMRAWILQRAGWYIREFDIEKSLIFQRAAHDRNRRMLRPPVGIKYPAQSIKTLSQAAGMLSWYSGFEHGPGAIAAVSIIKTKLVFDPGASFELFEDGLAELGRVLGMETSRPERDYGVGPDVLWLHGQHVLVIEAKNKTLLSSKAISKDYAGQLTQSTKWAAETYVERKKHVPIIAHPAVKLEKSAYPPDGTRVLVPAKLDALLAATAACVTKLSEKQAEQWSVVDVEKCMTVHKLGIEQVLSAFTDAAQ